MPCIVEPRSNFSRHKGNERRGGREGGREGDGGEGGWGGGVATLCFFFVPPLFGDGVVALNVYKIDGVKKSLTALRSPGCV